MTTYYLTYEGIDYCLGSVVIGCLSYEGEVPKEVLDSFSYKTRTYIGHLPLIKKYKDRFKFNYLIYSHRNVNQYMHLIKCGTGSLVFDMHYKDSNSLKDIDIVHVSSIPNIHGFVSKRVPGVKSDPKLHICSCLAKEVRDRVIFFEDSLDPSFRLKQHKGMMNTAHIKGVLTNNNLHPLHHELTLQYIAKKMYFLIRFKNSSHMKRHEYFLYDLPMWWRHIEEERGVKVKTLRCYLSDYELSLKNQYEYQCYQKTNSSRFLSINSQKSIPS